MQIPPEYAAELDHWIARLDSGASGALAALPLEAGQTARAAFVDQFTDEFGNRARTTEPFLRRLLDLTGEPETTPLDLDERLWWRLCSGTQVTSDLHDLISPGPTLTPPSDKMAIEHWTQVELCALHAVWTLNQLSPDPGTARRIRDAGVWIMHELQPDNAINRPWAIPVFVVLSMTLADESDRTMASMYAQTLLHNCSITMGRPDILSSCIMLHSADMLRGTA